MMHVKGSKCQQPLHPEVCNHIVLVSSASKVGIDITVATGV